MRDHLLRTSGLAWFAYCSARKLAPNHYGLKHTQQAVLSNSDPACFLRKRKGTTSPQYHLILTLIAQLGANSGANAASPSASGGYSSLAKLYRCFSERLHFAVGGILSHEIGLKSHCVIAWCRQTSCGAGGALDCSTKF
ncbi:hypothetical protein [Methyloceanibacter sp.]|uniref:hypothetical protein n=1 Tax=Methyloceanibacter sp. TaxID=1965321 RepID=UPI003C778DBE